MRLIRKAKSPREAPTSTDLNSGENQIASTLFNQAVDDAWPRFGTEQRTRPFWRFEDSFPLGRAATPTPPTVERESYLIEPNLHETLTGLSLPEHMIQASDGTIVFKESKHRVPIVRRPNIIPVTTAPDGELTLAWPKIADLLGAARSPVGRIRSMTHRAPKWQVNDPIPLPEKPFTADYPGPMERGTRLQRDMDGNQLTAKFIAGRQRAGESNVRIDPNDYDEIIEKVIMYPPQTVKARELPAGAVAAYHPHNSPGGPMVKVLDRLPKTRSEQAKAHEMGHMLDQFSDYKTIERADGWEMIQNYDRLLWGEQSPWKKRGGYFGPTSRGYTGEQAREELVAEAIRAYMADPNYFKSTAPRTAASIRRAINTHPNTRDVIQFNSEIPLGPAKRDQRN